jgi:hypothetical protein
MRLQDALFNWLQIKIVADARTDDGAAVETMAFFETILREDHGLTAFSVTMCDESYSISYESASESNTLIFDRELADRLLADINGNPKFNEAGC